MKKIIIKTLAVLLALNSCIITPIYADEDLSNDSIVVETDDANEIIDLLEEDESNQEIEIIDHQEEEDILQEKLNESISNDSTEELPQKNLNTGLLNSGSVLHTGNCGAEGDNLTYTHYSDNSLVISGTGDMADYYSDNNAPWYEFRGPLKKIIISDGVTSIGQLAFYELRNIQSVTIPSSVTSIGTSAFVNCTSLSKIFISNTVQTIGTTVFTGCKKTFTIYTNAGAKAAGWDNDWNHFHYSIDSVDYDFVYPVVYNTSLNDYNELNIDWNYDSVSNILTISGKGPMDIYPTGGPNKPWSANRNNIKKIVIEEGITSISEYAFEQHINLESVSIPDTVTIIGEGAFASCEKLRYVDVPSSVTTIGSNAFGSCSGLKYLYIPSSVTTVGSYLFSGSPNVEVYTESDNFDGWDDNWNVQGKSIHTFTNHEEFVDIINHQPVPSDLTIKEDTSGNIVIHTSEAAYLQALVAKQSTEGSPSSHFSVFYNNNSSAWWFHNSTSIYGDNIQLEYNEAKGNVTLANSFIKSRNIVNGDTLVRIDVEGYEYCEKTITLSRACKPAPTNVTIQENSNGDIVITCSNTTWIKLIAQSGSVLICDDYKFAMGGISAYLYGWYNTPNGSFAITNSGKTLTITNEHLLRYGIPNGSYYLQIGSNGYGVFENDSPLEITKGAKIVDPNTISVECDQVNGTILIKSSSDDNNEYMEKLASYSVYNYVSNKEVTESEGGRIRVISDDDSVDAWFSNYKHKNNGKVDSEYIDVELSDDKKTLTLTKEAIFRYHVIKNNDYDIYIRVPGYIDINKEISNLTVGVKACPTVEIEEDAEGNIIISSNDLEYLKALTEENSDNEFDQNYISIRTELQNMPNKVDMFRNRSYHYDLILDESAKTVTIENNEILAKNITNGTHDVELYAYGYSVNETSVTIEHACDLSPTDVTAKVNTNGDLVITSTDTDWIYQLATNGGVDFYSITSNDSYFVDACPENMFVISNNGKTATVRKDQILDANIANGSYSLALSAPGYSRVSITKTISLTKANKYIDPETISITYDENSESIIISSTNKDYLANLCKVYKFYYYSTNPNYSFQDGGSISFYNDDDEAYFENRIEYLNGKQYYTVNSYSLSADKRSVIIPKESIYNQALVKDNKYNITLHSVGYQYITLFLDEQLTFGVSNQLPVQIGFSFNDDNGNLYITANDYDWLEGIMYDQSNAGRIELYDEENNYVDGFSNYYYEEPVIERVRDNQIMLKEDAIWASNISTGNYHVCICSYGYKTFKTNQPQEIKGLKYVPTLSSIEQSDNRIIIKCDDKEYLKALKKETSYIAFKKSDNDEVGIYFVNQDGDDSIFYDETNEYAYVDFADAKDYIKKNLMNIDDLEIELFVFGYYTNNEDFDFKFINNPGTVIKGSTKQLSFSDFDESKVTWESKDTNIATIDDDGVLTAKELGTATIVAHYVNGSAKYDDSIAVTITSNSKVSLKIKTEDGNTIANTGTAEQLQVTATGYTLTDKDIISFESDNEDIATVDENGLITFNDNDKAGVVTIKATALNDRSASIKISVYNIDKSKKLTASYTGETLEVGDEVENKINVLAGGEDLFCEPELVYSSSKDSIVSVDENGKLTANGKGTATITVALKDDPAKRKATCKVTVIDRVIESISDNLNVEDNNALVLDKCKEPGDNNGVRYIHVSYGLLNKNNKLHINITDCGVAENNQDSVTPAKVTYKSSNTSIATVDANGYVTFKKAGKVTITVTVASNPKGHDVVSRDIELEAIDYTPRIEVNKFVLNKYVDYSNEYPVNNLHKILSTADDLITNYKITDLKGIESEDFEIRYNGFEGNVDTFSIAFAKDPLAIPAKTYTQLLQFCVGDDNWYSYKVTIQVTATLPTVTPKVTGFYNTFTDENTLELVNTVKNGTISNIEFVDDWAIYNSTTGKITGFTQDANGKLVTSGKVKFTFDGYTSEGYVEKTIKLPTKTTKPTVKLDNSTFTLYVPVGTTGNKEIEVRLLDNSKNVITSGTVEMDDALSIVNSSLDDNDFLNNGTLKVIIPVENLKSGKIVLNYKGDGWADTSSIPLTINIKTTATLPKAKLSASSITLDNYFANTGDVAITIPGSSEAITDVECAVTPSTGLVANYSEGKIHLKSSNTGTYKVTCKPKIFVDSKEEQLAPLTFTVKVSATIPNIKLKTTTIKYNLDYKEIVPVEFSIANNKYNASVKEIVVDNYADASGSPVSGEPGKDYNFYAIGNLDGNNINLSLNRTEDGGSYTVTGKWKIVIYPKFECCSSSTYETVSGSPVIVTLDINRNAPTAAVTVKNAINPLDKNSTSPVAVKLTNLTDDIIDIEITSDEYKDLFEIEDLVLKIKDNDFSNIKDGTIKVNAIVKTKLVTEGIATTLSIKVARKAPKVTLSKSTINVYDTSLPIDEVLGEIDLNYDEGFVVSRVEIPDNQAYKVEYNSDLSKLIVKMKDGSNIKTNSSTSFSVKLIWENDFNNNGKYAKTTTVKFNVKDSSNSIKTVK